jgi:Na+/H+-translocating membrane pyrophosphatase
MMGRGGPGWWLLVTPLGGASGSGRQDVVTTRVDHRWPRNAFWAVSWHVIVSELVVVIAVCCLSLVLTGFHARRSLTPGVTPGVGFGASPHDLERMLAAVQRACKDFLWQETKLLVALLAIVLLALAFPVAVWGVGAHAALGTSLGGICIGALAGAGVAHHARGSAARTVLRSLGALRQDRNTATAVTLRGASALAVAIDAASSSLAAIAFSAHYAVIATVDHGEPALAAVLASRSLAALAFGALCAAVVFQVGGTSLHTAAGVAATGARARHPRIARDEEQNPVLVAELVGDYVGGVVSRSTDAFAGLLLANAGVIMLAAQVGASNGGSIIDPLALVALPLLIRTLGQCSASVSLGSSRFEGQLGLTGIILAARFSHGVLLLAGVLGACRWLLGPPFFSSFALSGALGVLAGTLSAGMSVAGLRYELSRSGLARPAPTVARAFGQGLQRTWLHLLLVGACLGGAWLIGSRTPLVHGGAFALALAVAALLGAGAFSACESTFSMLTDNVRRIAALRRGQFDEAAQRRAAEMDAAGIAVGNLGQTQTILSGAAAALLAAVLLPLLPSGGPAPMARAFVSLAHPVVLLGGVLGAGGLLFHVGGMLRAASRAAAALDKDLTLRLSGDARVKSADDAEAKSEPHGALPGYRGSVQLAAAGATQALLPLALGAVLAPVGVAVMLRIVYGSAGSSIIVYGLMAFSALAALTGCFAALVAQGTCFELIAARKSGADKNPNTHSAIEFMERCIGPAALLGLKATVVSSLVTVPLLF